MWVNIGMQISFSVPFIVSVRIYGDYANISIRLPEEGINVNQRYSCWLNGAFVIKKEHQKPIYLVF